MDYPKKWYYADGQNAIGPLDRDVIKKMIQAGIVGVKTLVVAVGEEKWIELGESPLKSLLSKGNSESAPIPDSLDLNREGNESPRPEARSKTAEDAGKATFKRLEQSFQSFLAFALPVLRTIWKKVRIGSDLAKKQATKTKLEAIDLNQADYQIGKKAYEKDIAVDCAPDIRAQVAENRARIETLKSSEITTSDQFAENVKQKIDAASRMAVIQKLGFQERIMLTKLGTAIREKSSEQPELAEEIGCATKLSERIYGLASEMEALRPLSFSWARHPWRAVTVIAALFSVGCVLTLGTLMNHNTHSRSFDLPRNNYNPSPQFIFVAPPQGNPTTYPERNSQVRTDIIQRESAARSEISSQEIAVLKAEIRILENQLRANPYDLRVKEALHAKCKILSLKSGQERRPRGAWIE